MSEEKNVSVFLKICYFFPTMFPARNSSLGAFWSSQKKYHCTQLINAAVYYQQMISHDSMIHFFFKFCNYSISKKI